MNLLPMLNSKIWTFKATFATWLLRSGVKPLIIYASDNKLTLSLFFCINYSQKNSGRLLHQWA